MSSARTESWSAKSSSDVLAGATVLARSGLSALLVVVTCAGLL
jgi:hypothetical protein